MTYNPRNILKKYWIEELGCSEADMHAHKIVVRPHGTLLGYKGIMVLRSNETYIISSPKNLIDELTDHFNNQPLPSLLDPLVFKKTLGDRIDKMIGPAWLGYMAYENFKPQQDKNTKELIDWQLFEKFLSECPKNEIELSSLESGRFPVAAVFNQEKIVAASSFELMGKAVAHIGILTHPSFRGMGYAKKAISAIVEIAMQKKLGLQYWTHAENIASIRAAEDVGFTKFAETLAIRIK